MSPGGRIKDSDIESVRDRTDLVQLISEYVPLKKSGREFRGPCPFHKEKDPSFYVNPAKGVFFCFGCKASGGVFNFLMQLEGLTFNEAVERLADRIGYQLTYEAASPEATKERDARDRLLKLNQTAADYFRYMLKDSPDGSGARAYLEGRGLGPEISEEFHLGYAPPAWDAAVKFLTGKGFSERELVTAGLARERSGGTREGRGVYDIFRNRVIFPILDHRGHVVAFGGRRLAEGTGGDEPKYLNSPETPVYRKGRTLYGYFQGRGAIHESREAVVVEGYTDLLALWQAGLKGVVATLGTALTEGHFELLSRVCDTVYLAFDADRAGIEASIRPMQFFDRFRLDVMVVSLPEGEDPASLVEKEGLEAFHGRMDSAEGLLDFAARKTIERFDTSRPQGRRRAMEACVPIIGKVSSDDMLPVRDDLVRNIGGWLDVPQETVRFYVREAARGSRKATAPTASGPAPEAPAMGEKVEREALRLLLQDPEALIEHNYLDSDYFTDETNKNIFELLKDISVCDEEVLRAEYDTITRRMVEDIEDGKLRSALTRLMVEPLPDCEPGYEDKVFDRLSYMFFKRRKTRLEFEIGRVNKGLEPKKYDALCNQLLELDQVIKEQFPFDHR